MSTIRIGISPYRKCQTVMNCAYPAEYHCTNCHVSFCALHGLEHKSLVVCTATPQTCYDCQYLPLSNRELLECAK